MTISVGHLYGAACPGLLETSEGRGRRDRPESAEAGQEDRRQPDTFQRHLQDLRVPGAVWMETSKAGTRLAVA